MVYGNRIQARCVEGSGRVIYLQVRLNMLQTFWKKLLLYEHVRRKLIYAVYCLHLLRTCSFVSGCSSNVSSVSFGSQFDVPSFMRFTVSCLYGTP
jgi:hypothetical protein